MALTEKERQNQLFLALMQAGANMIGPGGFNQQLSRGVTSGVQAYQTGLNAAHRRAMDEARLEQRREAAAQAFKLAQMDRQSREREQRESRIHSTEQEVFRQSQMTARQEAKQDFQEQQNRLTRDLRMQLAVEEQQARQELERLRSDLAIQEKMHRTPESEAKISLLNQQARYHEARADMAARKLAMLEAADKAKESGEPETGTESEDMGFFRGSVEKTLSGLSNFLTAPFHDRPILPSSDPLEQWLKGSMDKTAQGLGRMAGSAANRLGIGTGPQTNMTAFEEFMLRREMNR